MSDRDDGGPAFPRTGVGNAGQMYDVPPQDGMSLRDWLAGQALNGQISSMTTAEALRAVYSGPPEQFYEWAADSAYRFADAMLKARSGK